MSPSADRAPGVAAAPERPRRRSRSKGRALGGWVLLALLLAAGLWYLGGRGDLGGLLRADVLLRRLAWPLTRVAAFVAFGLLAGQFIEALGWTARLGTLAWPLIRSAHLPKEAGAAFSAAFASGVAANTLLYTAWQEGRLNGRSLVLANILNASLPAYLLHLPTTFFVVYALLGRAALVYFGLTLLAALLRSAAVVVVGRRLLPPSTSGDCAACGTRRSWGAVWADTWPKFRVRVRRMLLIIVPVYVVIFVLAREGFFSWLGDALAHVVSWSLVPVEAMSVVVFSVVAEFTSGFAAAGALLASGGLTLKQVVIALLIGNVVATPVRALRHQLPHYMGIYTPGMGARLLTIGQGARVASVILVAAVYAVWG